MSIGGQNTIWKHATHGTPAVLVDYSAKTMSVTLSNEGEEVDATVFGNLYRDFERSFISGTFEAQYKYDATIYTVLGDIFTNGTSIDFEFSPNGSTAGYAKMTGAMVCTSLGFPAAVGELLTMTANFRINGTITFGTN